MPLFFILSGYFERGPEVSLKKSIQHSAQTLLIPYVSFYLISYIWWLIDRYVLLDSYTISLEETVIKPFWGLILGIRYSTAFSTSINGVLWFLLGLFFCKVFFKCLQTISSNRHWLLISFNILVIALVFFMFRLDIIYPYLNMSSGLMAVPFYTFGYYLKKVRLNDIAFSRAFVASILCTIVGALLFLWNFRVDMVNFDFGYGRNIIIFYINGIIGSLGVIFFSILFENRKNKLLLYLGANTLTIFALHILFLWNISIFFSTYVFTTTKFSIGEGLMVGFFILIVSSIPIYFINRYIPFILGKSTKKNS